MSTDADQANREAWSRAASGWERWQESLRAATAPVSKWMVDAIDPQPGETVLELAAGPGETGFIAAQRLGSSGRLISTDQSPEMVEVARRRAGELALENVEFAVVDAQRPGLEPASADAVLCRFGYMLMAEPDTALAQTREILRPGGRLALATWDTPDQNLWMATSAMQMIARGVLPMPEPGAPGPFAMADPEALTDRLRAAGFRDARAERIGLQQRYESFDVFWQQTMGLAAPLASALAKLDGEEVGEIRDAVHDALSSFEAADGSMEMPGRAIGAAARV